MDGRDQRTGERDGGGDRRVGNAKGVGARLEDWTFSRPNRVGGLFISFGLAWRLLLRFDDSSGPTITSIPDG